MGQTYIEPSFDDRLISASLQAYGKLSEPAVVVKVREADQGVAKDAIEAARSKFKDAFGKDGPDATLDTKAFLPAAGTEKEGENSWYALSSFCSDVAPCFTRYY